MGVGGMAGSHDLLRGYPVEMGALVGDDAVGLPGDRAGAEHGDDRVSGHAASDRTLGEASDEAVAGAHVVNGGRNVVGLERKRVGVCPKDVLKVCTRVTGSVTR